MSDMTEMRTLTIGDKTYEVVDNKAREDVSNLRNNLGNFNSSEAGSLEGIMSVKACGAVGDGIADDTAAFQTALANNRCVYVPGGTYKLSGELLIGYNCCIELAQDTVLEFSQNGGNCISMQYSASIRGNHATVRVPYGFDGNVIYVSSKLDTDVLATPPFTRWDPQWKAGRYITDLNIVKPDTRGFHYAMNPGDCCGNAVYIEADGYKGDNARRSTFIWGLNFSGLRIAGSFAYGIKAKSIVDPEDSDSGWNHEMRVEAVITSCEIGVGLEDCNNAYISAVVQPIKGMTADDAYFTYAKHGIELIRSRNTDLSGSRVWDWNADNSLWEIGGMYQHIAMIGECRGTILNDFYYWETSYDIRDQIYTDTPSNLEKINILQEPFTRWFKPVDSEPYFNNGYDGDQRLCLKSEQDALFQSKQIPLFTNVLPMATDKDGNVFYENGYVVDKFWLDDGVTLKDDGWGTTACTGFIPVNGSSLIRCRGAKMAVKSTSGVNSYDRVIYYDSNKNKLFHINVGIFNDSYYVSYTDTSDGFELQIQHYPTAAYVTLNFLAENFSPNTIITVDEPIEYAQEGFLADGIYVDAEYVTGLGDRFIEANKRVTAISSESTDNQYPTAKAVYDLVQRMLSEYTANNT